MKNIFTKIALFLLVAVFLGTGCISSASADSTSGTSAEETSCFVKKNGRPVTSASELSMYDVVTFGNYAQTAMGTEKPIQWYVIGKEGNKVMLLSVYGLAHKKFHEKNEEVAFQGSDLFRWLNKEFKANAFTEEESAMLAAPVSLLSKSEAEQLPLMYRITSATDYAIAQGANPTRCLWWVGNFYMTKTFVDYYGCGWYELSYASAAYCMNDAGEMSAYQVNFSGKVARPMIIIQF